MGEYKLRSTQHHQGENQATSEFQDGHALSQWTRTHVASETLGVFLHAMLDLPHPVQLRVQTRENQQLSFCNAVLLQPRIWAKGLRGNLMIRVNQ